MYKCIQNVLDNVTKNTKRLVLKNKINLTLIQIDEYYTIRQYVS